MCANALCYRYLKVFPAAKEKRMGIKSCFKNFREPRDNSCSASVDFLLKSFPNRELDNQILYFSKFKVRIPFFKASESTQGKKLMSANLLCPTIVGAHVRRQDTWFPREARLLPFFFRIVRLLTIKVFTHQNILLTYFDYMIFGRQMKPSKTSGLSTLSISVQHDLLFFMDLKMNVYV